MLLKEADDKGEALRELERLATTPELPEKKRKEIEQELWNLRKGIKGERESAYEIDFLYKESRNWAVIHDLRLEVGDRVAQIDHLLINRLLEVYVCETKNFSDQIKITENGEFLAFYGKYPKGIPSPLAQNDKHVRVVREALKGIQLPKRLGFTLEPSVKGLVLLSKSSRISRPPPESFDTRQVIKADQLGEWLGKDIDVTSVLSLAKAVSSETVWGIADRLVALHRPIAFDYRARFGVGMEAVVPVPEAAPVPSAVPVVEEVTTAPAVNAVKEEGAATEAPKQKRFFCASCKKGVSDKVANFCWTHKERFGGRVYCMGCQRNT